MPAVPVPRAVPRLELDQLLSQLVDERLASLTEREREILDLITKA